MLLDYLKYLLMFQRTSNNKLSETERKLISLVNKKRIKIDDGIIRRRILKLRKNKGTIINQDFGAGSKRQKGNIRSISKIASYASIRPKFGQLYAAIIKEFNFKTCIELGTSFGIGTSYLAINSKKVITIEGCPETADIANDTFKSLKLNNIDLKIGLFSSFFSALKGELSAPAFIYVDGNHKYKPTIEYFEYFEANSNENTILVIDDIYWSDDMKQAWSEIKEKNYFSIDLYKVGIVLLKKRSAPLTITCRF